MERIISSDDLKLAEKRLGAALVDLASRGGRYVLRYSLGVSGVVTLNGEDLGALLEQAVNPQPAGAA